MLSVSLGLTATFLESRMLSALLMAFPRSWPCFSIRVTITEKKFISLSKTDKLIRV